MDVSPRAVHPEEQNILISPMDRKLGGPPGRSGVVVKRKGLPLPGTEPQLSSTLPVIILIDVSGLIHYCITGCMKLIYLIRKECVITIIVQFQAAMEFFGRQLTHIG
jgi:hypothetical protein